MEKPDLSLFPTEPGVYLYKDANGRILYVGKARRLRQRLASYFRDASALTAKTRLMLQNAASIDILRTGTEKEALLLEASLIKKHRPRYNIVLRDDKEYLLYRIRADHPYPRVEVLRKNQHKGKNKGARFFGPFSSGFAARETWRLIHKHFPLRRCTDRSFANRARPCLYYDIKQCLAPCVLPVEEKEYKALLNEVVLLLLGKSRDLLRTLQNDMTQAAEEMRYEDAARLRDRIRAVESTIERQSVVLPENRTLDLIGVAQTPEGLALGVVFVRQGLLLDGRNFFWPGLGVEDTPELICGFLAQYYLSRKGLGDSLPPRIVVPWLPSECDERPDDEDASNGNGNGNGERAHDAGLISSLEAALSEIRGAPVHITKPKGQDEDNLLLMAASNAREAIKGTSQAKAGELLARRLRAPSPVSRIEVVDISHTGGRQTKAGMVVFEDEEPLKSAYRVYNLDEDMAEAGVEAGDDYAALSVWAKRRARSGPPWPDLMLIDGGKGQLAGVYKTFVDCGVVPRAGITPDSADALLHDSEGEPPSVGDYDFILASIAKARDEEGRADRRAGNVSDRIFLPGRSNPLPLQPGSPELLFLQRVRDTAHDFVIGRHRQARAKATLSGELTRLPGVGPKTARLLFERFGSLAAMAEAGEEALRGVPGIGKARAADIAKRLALLVENKES